MALDYKNKLYGPVYIDGDYTSIYKLLRRLAKVIGQEAVDRFKEETLVDGELPALNQIYAWLEESGIYQYCKECDGSDRRKRQDCDQHFTTS